MDYFEMSHRPDIASIADAQTYFNNSGFPVMLDEELHIDFIEYLYRHGNGGKSANQMFADFVESKGYNPKDWDLDQ